ncbi:MAG TPA: hypothetical protein VF173_05365 [Thermoanaerobaculia bacterium]|nr:hypothetical protein [Thermoanaerobaculia bacterium]
MKIKRSILVALLLFPFSIVAHNASAQQDHCIKQIFPSKKLWINSAVWLDHSKVLIVDTLNSNLLVLDTFTGSLVPLSLKGFSADHFFPSSILPVNKGFLLSLLDSQIVLLDQHLVPLPGKSISLKSSNPAGGIGALYDWTVTNGRITAYGAALIPDAGKPFTMGFLAAALDDPTKVRVILPDANFEYYTLGFSYFTSIENDSYFIAMYDVPSLFKLPSNSVEPINLLATLPEPIQHIPRLQNLNAGPKSAEAIFREVEGLSLPVGLYSYGNFLYLLARQAEKTQDSQGTVWWLYQIDASVNKSSRERVVAKLRLPTSANHLTLLPGSDSFLLFEKGPVESLGAQRVLSTLRIPTSWFTNPARSPLKSSRATSALCK